MWIIWNDSWDTVRAPYPSTLCNSYCMSWIRVTSSILRPVTCRSHKHAFPIRTFYWARVQLPQMLEIKLTDEENELCTLLDQCTRHMKETEGIETSCRIAGGWVRDKVRSTNR